VTLYERLLGSAFDRMPPTAQRLHARAGAWRYAGEVDVERGRGVISRLCAWATRLPPAGCGAIAVDMDASDGIETWTRHVHGHAMRSTLRAHNGRLRERLGLVTFDFRLRVQDATVHWQVERVRALGLPLPASWFARVHAREFESDGRYRYDVRAVLPGIGLLVHYRGWLDVC